MRIEVDVYVTLVNIVHINLRDAFQKKVHVEGHCPNLILPPPPLHGLNLLMIMFLSDSELYSASLKYYGIFFTVQ